ncbi:hypothetical protein [Domibacillus sp.]|uniref:hypothetical protein n=1 Tax=Domibacillus sp. TaxID=1969783 RepID=UPI0028112C2B|nr:hypothetical protein [Domibacillus sp.]
MRSSLFFASGEEDIRKIQTEYTALKEAGFDVDYVEREEMKKWVPFSRPAAEEGVRVFEPTEVSLKKADEAGVVLRTEAGHLLKAKKSVFAQGYETQETVKDRNAVVESSYAIITNPVEIYRFGRMAL